MENTSTSQASLFWNKLGKWQVLAVILTLVAFFAFSHFMGDKSSAALLAGTVTVCLAAAAFAALTPFAGFAAVFAAYASSFALIDLDLAILGVAIVLGAFVVIAALATEKANRYRYGIRQNVIWYSFAAEFVVIILPMLLT